MNKNLCVGTQAKDAPEYILRFQQAIADLTDDQINELIEYILEQKSKIAIEI